MRSISLAALVIVLSCLLLAVPAAADVQMHNLFCDNMVLQQGMKVPVWGTADPGEKIAVSFNGQKVTTKAGSDGKWMVRLEPMKAGGPYKLLVVGKNMVLCENVMVGEVWVCSGQSNMWWTVKLSANSDEEIANAKYPNIRLFTVPQRVEPEPVSNVDGKWVECSPETIPDFSAAAYYFGRELHKTLNVPIGLIHTSWGGTPAESWTRLEVMKADPELSIYAARYDQQVADMEKAKADYPNVLAKWKEDSEKAKAEGKEAPAEPKAPAFGPYLPSSLYNGMIAPLIPYGIKGAIWYQGESNAAKAYQYRRLFPLMIKNWRKDWGQGDFPFLFVQLANWAPKSDQPMDDYWAELREAQLMTLSLKNTGMAVAVDIGDPTNIHPANKQEVGRRLALNALAMSYGKKLVYSGPIYRAMEPEYGAIVLVFDHIGGGLVAKGDTLKGFTIAGEDRKFVPAEAKIVGNNVVVSSPQVKDPVAVRYSWAINPDGNLYNKAGLPASPFRTDDWPGKTVENK